MNIVIFDTETISVEKPFCYNVGYIIVDTETKEIVLQREYIIEQIWSNAELFSTAYYASKRQIYVSRMRGRSVIMEKWGYVTQQMIRDFKSFDITQAYAYNSDFDERVFEFMSEWFKTINPFETVEIFDIRGYACEFIANEEIFQQWCEVHNRFTDSGNYSTTAETMYQYVALDSHFEEEHTALSDSKIEWAILKYCLEEKEGGDYGVHYKCPKSIVREVEKELTVKMNEETYTFKYKRRTNRGNTIYLK